jgi:GAF domain-containing protein
MKLILFSNPNQPNPSMQATNGRKNSIFNIGVHQDGPERLSRRLNGKHPLAFKDASTGAPKPSDPNTPYAQVQILKLLCWITIVSAIFILAFELPDLIQSSDWTGAGFYGLCLVGLVTSAIFHRQAYSLRVAIFLASLLVLGMVTSLTNGLYETGQVFLLALPFFAALLTARRGRLISLSISIGAACLIVGLILTGNENQPNIPVGSPNGYSLRLISWMGVFACMAIGGSISGGVVSDGLKKSLELLYHQNHENSNERDLLEGEIRQRTDELQRRLVQIRTAAEINRAISRRLDIDQLLPEVCNMVCQRFNLYYVGIFLIEDTSNRTSGTHSQSEEDNATEGFYSSLLPLNFFPGDFNSGLNKFKYAVLKAGSGEAGQRMILEGHKLEVGGDSMIGWATANLKPRIAQNVGFEEVHFSNPHLPLTRSELALPILIREGMDDEFSADTEHQGERILGAMTIQSSEEAAFDKDDILILQSIADSLASAIENSRLFATSEASLKEIRTLHSQYLAQAWSQETALQGEIAYTFGSENHLSPYEPANGLKEIPIRLRDQVIGYLNIEPNYDADKSDENFRTWSNEELSFIEAVTNQAALALENARLLEETRRKANLERTATTINNKMWASADIEKILQTALQELTHALGASEGWIELWPGENDKKLADELAVDQSNNGSQGVNTLSLESHGSN